MYECKVRKCTILHLQKQGVLHIFASVVFDSLALTLSHFITYIENIVKRLQLSNSEMPKKMALKSIQIDTIVQMNDNILEDDQNVTSWLKLCCWFALYVIIFIVVICIAVTKYTRFSYPIREYVQADRLISLHATNI